MPLLPATMPVQELDVSWRQCMWHHYPRVEYLAGGDTHQGCVTMLPPGWRQRLSDSRRCIWLVTAADDKGCTPQ